MSADLDFTVDELERIVVNAIKAHDVKAVDVALCLMATKDPHRAQDILDTIELGLALQRGSTYFGRSTAMIPHDAP